MPRKRKSDTSAASTKPLVVEIATGLASVEEQAAITRLREAGHAVTVKKHTGATRIPEVE